MTALDRLWDLLRDVRRLSFVASSGGGTGWSGRGAGTVVVQTVGEGVMTFTEEGAWRQEGGREIRFSNVYRWTLAGNGLRLEHLRFGEAGAVFLFDLESTGEVEWRSISPHLCREDCYTATLVVHDGDIVLRWSIDGPRKRETIEYRYSAGQRGASGR